MATTAPNNYTHMIDVMFTDNMSGWDFVNNTKNVYTTYIPESIFWFVILIIPYITMYNRQNGILIVAITYLITGGIMAGALPTFLGSLAYWFIVLGLVGILYKLFNKE